MKKFLIALSMCAIVPVFAQTVEGDTASTSGPMTADAYVQKFYSNWDNMSVEEKATARRTHWDTLTDEQKEQARKDWYQAK